AAESAATQPDVPARSGDGVVLTVSGYIINGTRIELSPRFMGVVNWIGVEKGDSVTNGQVLVTLDDTEFQARLKEVDGRTASARAALKQAELSYERINRLARTDIESAQARDDAILRLESAKASLIELEGVRQLAQAYVDWCIIRSPIDGVILERLVDPDELVTPQSFGGTRGPSTALVALANPRDIQIEIDMNESDLSKVALDQKCRVSPEAYPDKVYEGYVKEIAPEANRSKGTLQIKVQVEDPDRFLTPELSARVDFLR
ncbi:MAG: efflux RND transporter periplasmic adaptor subunit, partial [Verrucomicrobia bacterium]|nr:efflux RND transporter periplasmic adaptor subunit [Verrucomicrobiota bacterium]